MFGSKVYYNNFMQCFKILQQVVLLQMYDETDRSKGHIPSKPALFATQCLSMLLSNEELQTCTIEPSENGGK